MTMTIFGLGVCVGFAMGAVFAMATARHWNPQPSLADAVQEAGRRIQEFAKAIGGAAR